jgi:hypothetical protein
LSATIGRCHPANVAKVLRLLAFALIVVGAGYVGLTYLRANQSCVVGLAGHAVSIEVKGQSANAQCASFQGVQAADGSGWYVVQGGAQPGGAVICQSSYSGDLFTVRDQGVLNALGTEVCQRLAAQAGP